MAAFLQQWRQRVDRRASSARHRRQAMATYISLLNFTDQGIRNIKESPDRYTAFKSMAEKMGVSVKGIYYTVGQYDMVVVTEGTDEAATAALLKSVSLGYVPSPSLGRFSVAEMKKILTTTLSCPSGLSTV